MLVHNTISIVNSLILVLVLRSSFQSEYILIILHFLISHKFLFSHIFALFELVLVIFTISSHKPEYHLIFVLKTVQPFDFIYCLLSVVEVASKKFFFLTLKRVIRVKWRYHGEILVILI